MNAIEGMNELIGSSKLLDRLNLLFVMIIPRKYQVSSSLLNYSLMPIFSCHLISFLVHGKITLAIA